LYEYTYFVDHLEETHGPYVRNFCGLGEIQKPITKTGKMCLTFRLPN